MMKVAQMMATIPEALPADYASELMTLQSQAPPMGAAFVRRRMQAELGPDWRRRFAEFDLTPAAAASLGQVHRAASLSGAPLACKLQYPDMASAVEVDLSQLELIFSIHRRMGPAIDTREIAREIGARIREELDYAREAKLARLYAADARRPPAGARSQSVRRTLDAAPADAGMARRRAAGRIRARGRRGPQRHCARAVRGMVAAVFALRRHSRRSASGQLFRRRDGKGRGAADRGGQSVRLRLRTHLSRQLRRRRRRALSRAEKRRRSPHRPRLRNLGLSRSVAGDDRGAEHLGALHLRAADRRPRAHHRRRDQARRLRPARDLRGDAGAQGRRRRPEGSPRIRLHGPRRDRPRRRLPAPERGD